jgi:NitT/TauT family transport system ATP-binding protein
LVLDPRPGRVREIVEVPVARPRNHIQLREPEFLATKAHLETIIHPEDSHEAPVFDKLPMGRMTDLGDDVE